MLGSLHGLSLPSLLNFFIFNNSVSGAVPSDIGSSLQALQNLMLTQNRFCCSPHHYQVVLRPADSLCTDRFSGSLPTSFSHLGDLVVLDLSENLFNGDITNIRPGTRMSHCHIQKNRLSGSLPKHFVATSPKLFSLLLNQNKISGTISSTLFSKDLSGSVGANSILDPRLYIRYVALSTNKFSGTIHSELCQLHNMYGLTLNNQVTVR